MLERLLAEIQSGGTLEPGSLAKCLGTTPEMVMAMLAHLARLGMLQRYLACNTQNCEACGVTSACSTAKERGNVWQLNSRELNKIHM